MEKKDDFKFDVELLVFSKKFSAEYTTLSVGTYYSDNEKYQINYLKEVPPVPNTGYQNIGRVSNQSGIMDLSKTLLNKKVYSSEYVLFLILWLNFSFTHRSNPIIKDDFVITYLFTQGIFQETDNQAKKNILKGMISSLKHSPTPENKQRVEYLSKCYFLKPQ